MCPPADIAVSSLHGGLAGEPASYEAASAELEHLVAAMEGGQLPLDRLLDSYRRGVELLAFCRSRLKAVEDQVRVLEEGQLAPWRGHVIRTQGAGSAPGRRRSGLNG